MIVGDVGRIITIFGLAVPLKFLIFCGCVLLVSLLIAWWIEKQPLSMRKGLLEELYEENKMWRNK